MERVDDETMSRNDDFEFADDALFVDENTTVEDVQEFIKRRVENPYTFDDVIVWNFASHLIDYNALEEAIETKLKHDKYLTPFQVGGVWGAMFHMLPHSIREAEILVYHPDTKTYKAYSNFYRDVTREGIDSFRVDLDKRVKDIDE